MAGLNQSPPSTQKVLLSAACVIVVVGGLKFASDLLIPIVLAMFLALLSLPVTRWLTKHYVPHPLAVLLTVGLDLLVLVGVVNITLYVTQQFKGDVLLYANKLQSKAEAGDEWINEFIDEHSFFTKGEDEESSDDPGAVEEDGEAVASERDTEDRVVIDRGPQSEVAIEGESNEGEAEIAATDDDADPLQKVLAERGGEQTASVQLDQLTKEELVELLEEFDVLGSSAFAEVSKANNEASRVRFLGEIFAPNAEAVLSSMQVFVKSAASLLSATFFVGLVMIFILVEVSSRSDTIDAVREARGPDLSKFRSATEDVQKYLGIKTLVSAATGILAWILTDAFGLEAAPLWGMVAFLLNYIPAIGSIIAAVPPVLVALVQFEPSGVWQSLGIATGYLAINVVLGNFVEPMLLGKRFGISTLVVILSVIFWRWVWGPVGMFLAVPLTMIVMVMLENSKDFRWLAVAMGKKSARMPVRARIRRRLSAGRTSTQDSESKSEAVPSTSTPTGTGEA